LAWINDEWLDKPARQERIKLVSERAKKLRALIESGRATEYHNETFRITLSELKRLKRIDRAEDDMLFFFYEYFSEARNPGNPDNLVPTPDVDIDGAPDFHLKLSRILDSVSSRNKTARIAWAASRGHAKSAYLSNAFPVHEIAYRKRKMILIISETNNGSKKFIKWVANQLKHNQKLREDFGPLLHEKKMLNEKDSEDAFLTLSGAKMEATSLGMQIRGFRNGAYRPDLILLDDLESRDSNNTPDLRQKAKDWLNADLMPAYDPTRTAIIFMGTIVHHDSLLNYVLNERRDFIKNRFPAIISPPERADLWAEFERIYKDYEPTDEELAEFEDSEEERSAPNVEAALKYFEANREEMERGSEVLWPQRFPIQFLALEKLNYGTKAFNTEFMNNPVDEDSQIFKPDTFTYYDAGMTFPHRDYNITMGIDFAMGKQRGDYSAIVVLARHKITAKYYVIHAWGARVHPDAFLTEIVTQVLRFQPDAIAAEAQMAQEFFVHKLKQELQAKGFPSSTRVKEIHQRTRKELRIEALIPDIEKGTIQFSKAHALLIEHFERYGSNWHDDLPDALEMAYSINKRGRKKIRTTKPKWAY